ncbi:hypothetical protein [Carboxylicivirga sp. M1479]|uniref:hypothetical protein n=1 Tax=Carboxylicivirga sp. M1479 TaxID=2594476 RepID=UPI001178705B|nr:hypothetical protein [Carboxylicivirga sp. M1479]TRX65969.1 hypothetical protein FNN09_15830 [Carboxylicivirga sp. M1479]
MKTLKTHLNKITGIKVLWLFIVTNLVYATMLLFTIPQTMAFADGMKLLDMMPGGYDSAYVSTLLAALGESGRYLYLWRQIPLDMIYPVLFILCYGSLLAYVLKKMKQLNTTLWNLCLIPLIAGVFDYAENFGIIRLLSAYPDVSVSLVTLTSAFSVIKSTFTTLYFIVLIVLLLICLVNWMKARANKS